MIQTAADLSAALPAATLDELNKRNIKNRFRKTGSGLFDFSFFMRIWEGNS